MPEGDTLYRTAAALRPHLVGRKIVAASARQPGPIAEKLIGATVESVTSLGKQLLIGFDSGLELRTHLGLHGSWHRYAPGERWLRPPSRARLVLEVPGAVAVCFDAPTVELFEARAAAIHPVLTALGPDLLGEPFGEEQVAEATRRLRAPERASLSIAEALLDQTALAGIGNVYKSEVLFLERVYPFARLSDLWDAAGPEDTVRRLVLTARRLLLANRDGGPRDTSERTRGRARQDGPAMGLWSSREALPPLRVGHSGSKTRPARSADILVSELSAGSAGGIEMSEIEVDCSAVESGTGWLAQVTVTEGASSLEFEVRVSRAELERYSPGRVEPSDLVRRSFEFLLAREPKESILRSFDLSTIGRYYPEYGREILRR